MLNNKYHRLAALIILILFTAVLNIMAGCSGDASENALYPGEVFLDIDFDKAEGMASGSIDSIKTDSDNLIIGGWAVSDFHLLVNPAYYVVFESGEINRYFEANLIIDDLEELITGYSGPDEDFAAFQAIIEKEAVTPGFYRLSILIVDGEKIAAVNTDRYLMNGEEYIVEDAYLTLEEDQSETKVYFGIDSFEVVENHLVITGWGFLDGQSTAAIERNLLLRTDGEVKSFSVEDLIKKQVASVFSYKNQDLEHLGFKAEIPLDEIGQGDYQLGLYISSAAVEGIAYLDLIIRDQERLLSRPVDITIDEDELDGYMWFHFDWIDKKDDHLHIRGWSFLTDMHNYDIKHYVLLRKEEELLAYGVKKQLRPGLTEHFAEWQGTNLDQAGFSARIPLEDLPPGQYEVGLYAEVAGIKDSLFIMRFVTIE